MPSDRQRQGVNDYIRVFNQLDRGLDGLSGCTTEAIIFSDPFHRLQGREALAAYLRYFAEQVERPRFKVVYCGWDGAVCLVRWDFSGGLKQPGDWCFSGVSELHVDTEGRVFRHIDHWDSGRHFYRRMPLIGWLIRQIEKRLRPPSASQAK